jgi:hypothetical protein
MKMFFSFLPDNFTHRGRYPLQPPGVHGLVQKKPGLTGYQLFSSCAPSESALISSIGFFFYFLNAGQGWG